MFIMKNNREEKTIDPFRECSASTARRKVGQRQSTIKARELQPSSATRSGNVLTESNRAEMERSAKRWAVFCRDQRHGFKEYCRQLWLEGSRMEAYMAEVGRVHLFTLWDTTRYPGRSLRDLPRETPDWVHPSWQRCLENIPAYAPHDISFAGFFFTKFAKSSRIYEDYNEVSPDDIKWTQADQAAMRCDAMEFAARVILLGGCLNDFIGHHRHMCCEFARAWIERFDIGRKTYREIWDDTCKKLEGPSLWASPDEHWDYFNAKRGRLA